MLGNGRLEAHCFDGKKRLCHIRGKMRKKVWVNTVSLHSHSSGDNSHQGRCHLAWIAWISRWQSRRHSQVQTHIFDYFCLTIVTIDTWPMRQGAWSSMEKFQIQVKLSDPVSQERMCCCSSCEWCRRWNWRRRRRDKQRRFNHVRQCGRWAHLLNATMSNVLMPSTDI